MDKFDLLKDIFSALEIKVDERTDISNIILRQDTLKSNTLITDLNNKVPNLKSYYNSSKLTCLHKNSLDKQKFPAVNMFRQILKCNSFKMEPYVISKGYDKFSGKKLVERYYRIRDIFSLDNIQEEMKEEIKEEIKDNIHEEMKEEMKDNIQEEMKEEIKEEIKDNIHEEIKLELTEDNDEKTENIETGIKVINVTN
jgi:hypothetical protein